MVNYVTNVAIIILASLVFFFPSQPTWLAITSSCVTVALALMALIHQFVNGARTVEVGADDWQKNEDGSFHFVVKRKFSNPKACATYLVGNDGTRELVFVDVVKIDGGFCIKSLAARKLTLEIS